MTGLPGSGKTTCGELLAKALDFRFADSDELIQSSEELSIKEIFARHGESRFRSLEKETLRLLEIGFQSLDESEEELNANLSANLKKRVTEEVVTAHKSGGLVLAVGGGMPEPEANREALKRLGIVVYLRAEPEEIAHRIKADGERPLLNQPAKGESAKDNADMLLRLRTLLDRRRQAYESADITIDTAELDPDQIVNRLQQALKPQLQIL